MERNLSPMLPPSRLSPERTRMRNHAAQTQDAFADAMVVNFPQHPTIDQRRNGYVEILVRQGVPFDEAMQQAELAIPGSAMIPIRAGGQPATMPGMRPVDLGALGRDGDTMVAHINPAEAEMLKRAGGAGTINPMTGLPEFRPIGDSGRVQGYSNSRDHAARSGRNGSAGRPGGMGTQRSVFTSQDGLSKGITVAVGPGLAKKNAQRAATYNAAANNWNQSARQRSFANFLNAASPMGFSMEPPDIRRPATFSGGDYHLGWNPGSLAGLTGLVAPGSGFITGPLGQMAYSALGGKNLILGGDGDMGMPTWDAPGTDGSQQPSPTGPLTPGGGQLAGRTEGGAQLLPSIASAPGPLRAAQGPQAPVPSAPVNTATQVPGAVLAIPGPSPYSWIRPSWSVNSLR